MNYASIEPNSLNPDSDESSFIREAESSEPSVTEAGFELNELTLSQTARILDISVATARRLVLSERLRGVKMMIGDRLCWRVPKQAIAEFKKDELSFGEPPFKANPASHSVNHPSLKPGSEKLASGIDSVKPSSSGIPAEALLAALDTAQKALDRLAEAETRLEAQFRVSEEQRNRAELAERQRLALEMELRQYQVALTEQAESLVETHALQQAAEMKVVGSRISTSKPSFGQRLRSWIGGSRKEGTG